MFYDKGWLSLYNIDFVRVKVHENCHTIIVALVSADMYSSVNHYCTNDSFEFMFYYSVCQGRKTVISYQITISIIEG